MLGLEKSIDENNGFVAYNLGNGNGFSVLDVIKTAESVTGKSINYQISSPRQGDPSILVAESSLAKSELGWSPTFGELSLIIKNAWNWHKSFEGQVMKVAIVHYWILQMRGGEKVLEALCEMYPDADIYTHVYNKNNVSEVIRSHNVFTTFISKLPFAKKLYKLYLP